MKKIAEQKLENLILILVIFSLVGFLEKQSSNSIYRKCERQIGDRIYFWLLNQDLIFHITVQLRNISDFFGFGKIPAQNLLLPLVEYRLYCIARVGTEKMINMDFQDILPLGEFQPKFHANPMYSLTSRNQILLISLVPSSY